MSSNDTDRRDHAARGRAIDAALRADREGHDRLIRQADEPPPTSHGDKSAGLPGVRGEDDPL